MEKCGHDYGGRLCNKKLMPIPPHQSGAGDGVVLKRCPQHHWWTLDGQAVPEPGTDAWREYKQAGAPVAAPPAPPEPEVVPEVPPPPPVEDPAPAPEVPPPPPEASAVAPEA